MDAASNNQTPTLLDHPPSERRLASPFPPPHLFPSLQPLEYLQNNQRRGSITDPSLHASPPDPLDPDISSNSPPRSYSSEHRVKRSPRTIRPSSPFVFGDASLHSSDLSNSSFRGSLRSPSNDPLLDSSRSPDRSDDSSSRTRDKDIDDGDRDRGKDRGRDRDRDKDDRDRDRDRDSQRDRERLPSPRWLDKRSSDAASSSNINILSQSHSKYIPNSNHRFPSLMAEDSNANRLFPPSHSFNVPVRRHSIAEHPLSQRFVPETNPQPSSPNPLNPPGPSHLVPPRSHLATASSSNVPSLPHGLKRKISPERGVGHSLSGTGLYPMGEESEDTYPSHQFVDIQAPAPKRRGSAFDTHRIGIAQLSLYDRRDNADSRVGPFGMNIQPGAGLNSASWWLADRRDSTSSMFSTASLTTNASAGGYASSGFSGDSSFTSQQSHQPQLQPPTSPMTRGHTSPPPPTSQALTPSLGAQERAATRQNSLTNLAWSPPNTNMGVNAGPNIGLGTNLAPNPILNTNVNANATNSSAGSSHEAATSTSSNPPSSAASGVESSSAISGSGDSRHLRTHSPTSIVPVNSGAPLLSSLLSSSSESQSHTLAHSQSSVSPFSSSPSAVSPLSATPSNVTSMPPDRRMSMPDAFGHGHGPHSHYYNPHTHSHLAQLSHPHPHLSSHQSPSLTATHTRTLRSTSRNRGGSALPHPQPPAGITTMSTGGTSNIPGRGSDRPGSTLSDMEGPEEDMSISSARSQGQGSSSAPGLPGSTLHSHHPASLTYSPGSGSAEALGAMGGGGIREGASPYSRSPELRISHKLAERKRRKEMKDLFDELRDQLPADRGMKASKWEILTKAVDFIQTLKVNQQDMARELEFYKRELEVARGGMFHTHSHSNPQTASTSHHQQQPSPSQSGSRPSANTLNIFSHSTLTPPSTSLNAMSSCGSNSSPDHGLTSSNTTPRESAGPP